MGRSIAVHYEHTGAHRAGPDVHPDVVRHSGGRRLSLATTGSRCQIEMTAPDLPLEAAELLGPYYVYVLVDPTDESVFYVGKGSGSGS